MSDLDQYLDKVSAPDEDVRKLRRIVKKASLAIQNLIKYGRMSRLYGSTHHQTSRFLESYVDTMREVLDEEEVLMFEINATEIR
ncbi:MAG: hypothetical protein VX519_01510, partial [Myxococcota bacterium]|nr:hypothetical protein [Myxococcota bacterium]